MTALLTFQTASFLWLDFLILAKIKNYGATTFYKRRNSIWNINDFTWVRVLHRI